MSDFSPSSQNDPTPLGHDNWRPTLPGQYQSPSSPPSSFPQPQTDFAPPMGSPAGSDPKKKNWLPLVAVLAALALVVGGAVLVSGWPSKNDDAETTTVTTAPVTAPTSVTGTTVAVGTTVPTTEAGSSVLISESRLVEEAGLQLSTGHSSIDVHQPILDVAVVADTIAPSVVTVISDVESEEFGNGQGTGTGVIITADGNILTNAHVVEDAVSVKVLLSGTTEPVQAEVLAADVQNDLALLDIEGGDFTPAVFAEPTELRVGDPVVAMGFALDLDGGPSVTLGIVSAVNRTLEMDELTALDGLVQTDAAISSGNSGGPLVNAAGEVVGINTAVARGDETVSASNVGFAISVDEILQVVPVLRNLANGEVRENGYLGVTLKIREDGGQGALVGSVEDGTPAADAGFQAGDVVLDVDGSPVNGPAGLKAAILDREPGEEIHITVLRDGAEVVLTAVLSGRPS